MTRREEPGPPNAEVDDQQDTDVSALRAKVDALRARLNQSDSTIAEFVGRLAHELRSPLGAILMWAHVLRTAGDADRDVAVAAIEASARGQSKLIAQLLDVARALAGRLRIERVVLDLREPVRTAVEAATPAAVARSLSMKLSIPDGPVHVKGDQVRLRDMVSHLVGNAIKFTQDGGTIEVRLMASVDTARIVVRDTGRGVARDDLPDIFTAFRSSNDVGDRPVAGGLGLGLAFVRLLAELHGGSISVASDGLDRGATFVVEIPLQIPA